jgi:chromosome segregation ATPase
MNVERLQLELQSARQELRAKSRELEQANTDLAVYMEERQAMENELMAVQHERDKLKQNYMDHIDSLRSEKETTLHMQKKLKIYEIQIKALEHELSEQHEELATLKDAVRPALKAMQNFERALLGGHVDLTV